MGLLGSTVKYGGLFLAAREGVKAIERHNDKKNAQQQQQQQTYNQYPQQQQPAYQQSRDLQAPYEDYPQQQIGYQQQPYVPAGEPQGSFHQVWCNGRCGGKCGGKEALMAASGMTYGQLLRKQVSDEKLPPAY
jgi:hypothetical protein